MTSALSTHNWLTVGKHETASHVTEELEEGSYRLRAEFGSKDVVQGGEQQTVVLWVQAQEVAEGEDDHFFGVSVHPLLDLCEDSLPRTQTAASEAFSVVWQSFKPKSLLHMRPSQAPLDKSDHLCSSNTMAQLITETIHFNQLTLQVQGLICGCRAAWLNRGQNLLH